MQHVIKSQDSHENLLERILSSDNMQQAWTRVKKNTGAAGVDRMSIDEMPEYLREQWGGIRESLMEGTYQPSPVLRVEIPKPSGGTRSLGIPTVLDRLIQQAIAQVLTEICDPEFSGFSYGFRPGRSAHDAVYKAREYLSQTYTIAVDMDLEKFFDTVNHDVLMCRVSRNIHDKRVLRLIGKFLRAGVCIDGRLHRTPQGVPQGGPLSPILSNVLLDDLDKELETRQHRFVRYADDFVIFVKSVRAGNRVMQSIRRFLERTLKLRVNEAKSHVRPTDQLEFLGFTFKKTSIRWSERAFQEFKRRVKRFTGRSWGVSMAYRLKTLAEYVRGWMNYFGIAEYYRPIPELDHWLRRRVRMCYWKQWRKCRTKVRNLLKLGVPLKAAMSVGMSRKSVWRLSKTYATQLGMTNQWLKEQGLISIKDLWVNMHYPATAR
jgi:RNA-directed DNA polymerase